MIYWIAPAFKLAPYVLGALDYLRSQLFPPAPVSSPVAAPYTPPFTGGQCPGQLYAAKLKLVAPDGTITYRGGTQNSNNNITGAISGSAALVVLGADYYNFQYGLSNINGVFSINIDKSFTVTLDSFVIVPPAIDNCGDPPNPSQSPSISDNGIATSAPPNLDSAPTVIEAVPPVVLPSFAAALAAALAAARNALDALDAIKAIARAIEALSDLLNKKNEEENKKEKEKKENQDTIRYEFGSIQKDGFLRLYPDSNLSKYVAQQLDISFVIIPSYLGKYFGKFSPNYYRYKPTSNLISSLGYISFVSPTFGILSTHHLEFRRSSIKVPENSIGFYYHLGLDGVLTANAFAFYTKHKP